MSRRNESICARLTRLWHNSVIRCFGFAQTADELAKIKYAERQIETRKKNFGIAYINLLGEMASTTALQSCIDAAMSDIAVLKEDIDILQAEVDRVNRLTQEKIDTGRKPSRDDGSDGDDGGGGDTHSPGEGCTESSAAPVDESGGQEGVESGSTLNASTGVANLGAGWSHQASTGNDAPSYDSPSNDAPSNDAD